MNPLAEKFIRVLEDEARNQGRLANDTEKDAKQYDQLAALTQDSFRAYAVTRNGMRTDL